MVVKAYKVTKKKNTEISITIIFFLEVRKKNIVKDTKNDPMVILVNGKQQKMKTKKTKKDIVFSFHSKSSKVNIMIKLTYKKKMDLH